MHNGCILYIQFTLCLSFKNDCIKLVFTHMRGSGYSAHDANIIIRIVCAQCTCTCAYFEHLCTYTSQINNAVRSTVRVY